MTATLPPSLELPSTKRVVYAGYQPYFVEMARVLQREMGFTPVYWIVVDRIQEEVWRHFPGAQRHDYYDAVKGLAPAELRDMRLPPLAPELLADFARHEAIALRMLERNDSHTDSFKFRDRIEHYYSLLRYWQAALDRYQPDLIVFETEPHQVVDFLLYQLGRYRGIRTVIFVPTSLNMRARAGGRRMRFFPVESFEEGSSLIRSEYRRALAEVPRLAPPLSAELAEYLSELNGAYANVVSLHLYDQAKEVKQMLDTPQRRPSPAGGLWKRIAHLISPAKLRARAGLTLNDSFQSDQKERDKPFRDSRLSYLQHVVYKSRSLKRKRALRQLYESMATAAPDLSVPYVLCTLHYQPERSTCPLGGYFVDQALMVELLAACLPKGWQLYVKDHYSQYVESYTRYGEIFRSPEFFRRLARTPGVTLLSLGCDTFQLVDRARAVASVTGTTGWEAVVRGRPALMFGHGWYRDCEGVFYTPTRAALEQALAAIEAGYQVDPSKVELFAAVAEANSHEGVIGGTGASRFFDISQAENGRAHADAVKALLAGELACSSV